jgi:hypothetical protein
MEPGTASSEKAQILRKEEDNKKRKYIQLHRSWLLNTIPYSEKPECFGEMIDSGPRRKKYKVDLGQLAVPEDKEMLKH